MSLEEANVERAELFADDATRKNITYYDLRATGITWRVVRGDNPLEIMMEAGHADFKTTQVYIRTAEAMRRGFGEPFPVLPHCLLYPTRPIESSQQSSQSDDGWDELPRKTGTYDEGVSVARPLCTDRPAVWCLPGARAPGRPATVDAW